MMSLNNKLITKPYKGSKKIRAKTNTGFASVEQRTTLIGLEVLVKARIHRAGFVDTIEKGQIAYFTEEELCTQSWASKTYQCEGINEDFVIIPLEYVVFVK